MKRYVLNQQRKYEARSRSGSHVKSHHHNACCSEDARPVVDDEDSSVHGGHANAAFSPSGNIADQKNDYLTVNGKGIQLPSKLSIKHQNMLLDRAPPPSSPRQAENQNERRLNHIIHEDRRSGLKSSEIHSNDDGKGRSISKQEACQLYPSLKRHGANTEERVFLKNTTTKGGHHESASIVKQAGVGGDPREAGQISRINAVVSPSSSSLPPLVSTLKDAVPPLVGMEPPGAESNVGAPEGNRNCASSSSTATLTLSPTTSSVSCTAAGLNLISHVVTQREQERRQKLQSMAENNSLPKGLQFLPALSSSTTSNAGTAITPIDDANTLYAASAVSSLKTMKREEHCRDFFEQEAAAHNLRHQNAVYLLKRSANIAMSQQLAAAAMMTKMYHEEHEEEQSLGREINNCLGPSAATSAIASCNRNIDYSDKFPNDNVPLPNDNDHFDNNFSSTAAKSRMPLNERRKRRMDQELEERFILESIFKRQRTSLMMEDPTTSSTFVSSPSTGARCNALGAVGPSSFMMDQHMRNAMTLQTPLPALFPSSNNNLNTSPDLSYLRMMLLQQKEDQFHEDQQKQQESCTMFEAAKNNYQEKQLQIETELTRLKTLQLHAELSKKLNSFQANYQKYPEHYVYPSLLNSNDDHPPLLPTVREKNNANSSFHASPNMRVGSLLFSGSEDVCHQATPTRRTRQMSLGACDPKKPSSARSPLSTSARKEHFSSRPYMHLATESDVIWLSKFLSFLRLECIEVFEATQSDVMERKTSKKIQTNQVGLRCRFCAHVPYRARVVRSSCFPSSIARIYQSLTMMIREHFSRCPEMPRSTRAKYTALKFMTKKGEIESKTHWIESAQSIGMVDTERGIFLNKPLRLTHPDASCCPDKQEASFADKRSDREKNTVVQNHHKEKK